MIKPFYNNLYINIKINFINFNKNIKMKLKT